MSPLPPSGLSSALLVTLMALVSATDKTHNSPTPRTVFVCGNAAPTVHLDPSVVYELKVSPNLTKDTEMTSIACSVSFSSNSSGFCILQEADYSNILDSNVELEILSRDAEKGDRLLHKLTYYPNRWKHRQYCDTASTLTFQLIKVNRGYPVNLSSVNLRFKIIDMRSEYRKLYLDEDYCDGTYLLNHSKISVDNSQSSSKDKLTLRCLVTVKKADAERKVCIKFGHSKPEVLSQQWDFYVSTEASLDPKFFLYQLNSTEWASREKHRVWCDERQFESLSLIFIRQLYELGSETPGNFHFVVVDYDKNKTIEDILEVTQQEEQTKEEHRKDEPQPGADDENSLAQATWTVVLMVAIGVACLALLTFVVIKAFRRTVQTVTNITIVTSPPSSKGSLKKESLLHTDDALK
ncbi:uncharacterized protein LOC131940770 isoform X2 [Physella acuta]|nr:uncharacterized protein LOC131940770 isoform X2 [Physella acuta]XP_059155553.1 uncharacterized protein LOC131940770 isoform X2 [Physella acuta]